MNSKIKNSFIRYGLVGVISALIDFILVIILFYVFKSNELLAITIGFSISSIFNYLAHKSFSFNARDISHHKSLIKYIIVVISSYFITLGIIHILILNGNSLFIAKIISLLIVYIYGFFISKYFIYK